MQPPTPRSYALAVRTGDYPRKTPVPLYMDMHTVHGGAAVDGIAQAHAADLKAQGAHDVRYLRYWVSEAEGKIFCLGRRTVCGGREYRASRGSRTGYRRRFRRAGRVVIRRRLVANLIGPAVAGRHDPVAAPPSRTPSEPQIRLVARIMKSPEAAGDPPERHGRYAPAPSSSS